MKHKAITAMLITLVCILLVTVFVLLATPVQAVNARQAALHQAAELLRAAGFKNDDPAIRALSAAWWREQSPSYNEEDVIALAKTAYGEYRLTDTPEQKMQCAAVMWCVIWHKEKGAAAGFADTIAECCAIPGHFFGYSASNPVTPELDAMARDVLARYARYKAGASLEDAGCVLPQDYLFFNGNGYVNTFRNSFLGGDTWYWTLPNPYEDVTE